jgi:DNA-binding LacI/PurR family transcriptional regulator
MAKKVTLKDIATHCAVSVTAVSAAFKRPQQISKALREKILETARELGYFPKTELKTIGLVFANFYNHFFGEVYNEVIYGILAGAAELGLNVRILNNLKVDYQELYDINAYLIVGNDSAAHLDEVRRARRPFVCAACTKSQAVDTRRVFYDCYAGVRDLTKFICNCGHKHIAIINGESDPQDIYWQSFRRAVQDVFSQNNLPLRNIRVAQASYQNIETVEIALNEILSAKIKPTCILCTNDLFAYYTYALLKRYGLKVPRDISVTGYDDIATPYYLEQPKPQLATISAPRIALGQQALNFLVNILQGQKDLPKDIILDTKFKVGKSVARI